MEGLKDILGDAYTEELESKIDKLVGKNFISRADFNAKSKELKELKEKTEGNQGDEWKTKYDKLVTDKEAEIAQLRQRQQDYLLDSELNKAKARNAKAVKALLDSTKIKFKDDNTVEGLQEQLEALRKDNGYLFDPAVKEGTGQRQKGDEKGTDKPENRPAVI